MDGAWPPHIIAFVRPSKKKSSSLVVMPKAEVGTPKWIATQWKKKGLNKLRWFCGLCKTSCRDANGFQLHLATEGHLRRQVEAAERSQVRDMETQYRADAFSEAFERAFLRYLVREKLGQRVRAHEAYRAVHPDDRQHAVVGETCWGFLGRFVADLKQRGEVEAWRDDDGWIVSLTEGAPACAWAMLDDSDAKALHTKIDEDDGPPADWRELKQKKRKKRDDDELAFRQAAKASSAAQGEKNDNDNDDIKEPLPMMTHKEKTTAFSLKKPPSKADTSSMKNNNTDVAFSLSSEKEEEEEEEVAAETKEEVWIRPGLVVKATKRPEKGQKCIVVDVDGSKAVVETMDGQKRRLLIDESDLETVIPNIGKPVRIVKGQRTGALATLLELNVDTFSASLRCQEENGLLVEEPYENFCKDTSLLLK